MAMPIHASDWAWWKHKQINDSPAVNQIHAFAEETAKINQINHETREITQKKTSVEMFCVKYFCFYDKSKTD